MSKSRPGKGELRQRTYLHDDETEGTPLYAMVTPADDHVLLGTTQWDSDTSADPPLFWFTRTQAIEVATALLAAVQTINEDPQHQHEDEDEAP